MSVSTFTMGGQRFKLKPDTIDWASLERIRHRYDLSSLFSHEYWDPFKKSSGGLLPQPSAWTYQFTEPLTSEPVKPVVKPSPFPAHVKAEYGYTILPKRILEVYTIRPSREFLKGDGNMAPIKIEWAGQIRFVHELHIGNDGETTFKVQHRGGCLGPQQNGVVQVTTASLAYR